MKIQNGNKTDLLDSLVKTAQVKPQKDPSVDQKKGAEIRYDDKVEISSRKQEIENLAARAKTQSVVREEKVESLKQAIEEGTYNAKGEIVAGSILKSNILDEML
jgi:flagellar biosynthesis anti-sigma factor FlgM